MERLGGREEHEGDKYLRLLGLEHLSGSEIVTANGRIHARDFLDICGEHARPVLVGFEAMSPNDPKYEAMRNALREMIVQYIEGNDSRR